MQFYDRFMKCTPVYVAYFSVIFSHFWSQVLVLLFFYIGIVAQS